MQSTVKHWFESTAAGDAKWNCQLMHTETRLTFSADEKLIYYGFKYELRVGRGNANTTVIEAVTD